MRCAVDRPLARFHKFLLQTVFFNMQILHELYAIFTYAHVQGVWEPLTQGKKAGRVRLSTFYKKSLYSHWRFTEKVQLRNHSRITWSLWLIGSCDSLHFCRNCVATSRRTTCASWVHWMILILNNPKSSWPTTWWPASQSLVCCQLSHDFDNSKARPNCLEASGLPLNCIGLLFFSDPFEFGNHLMIWLLMYAWNILN